MDRSGAAISLVLLVLAAGCVGDMGEGDYEVPYESQAGILEVSVVENHGLHPMAVNASGPELRDVEPLQRAIDEAVERHENGNGAQVVRLRIEGE